jgi:glutamate N-acetyltransferase/amino-acid N-acetyltransferase
MPKSDPKTAPSKRDLPRAGGTTAGGLLAQAFRRAVLRRQEQETSAPQMVAPKAKAAAVQAKPVKPAKAKALLVSPLAPARFPTLPPIAGVELAVGAAGIRYQGRTDLMIAALAAGTSAAGVFTRSTMPGAPIDWCKANLESEGRAEPSARLLIVNAGNANVFTGRAGIAAVEEAASAGAALARCRKREVFLASTGVIGEPMPKGKIEAALPKLWGEKAGTSAAWEKAARAIMTTDTFPKAATRKAKIGGVPVTLNGIAKGSGMIAPDLGTMLAYVFTDAALPSSVLQTLLVLGVRDTFNAITVDSDTSTSDMVLLFATGKSEPHDKVERAGDPRLREFRTALYDLMGDLSRQVVCDGEGASKLISVAVSGAASAKAARAIAFSIANSPLVKTAIAGCDANWGRVVMAVGKAGEAADRDKLSIKFGGLPVAKNGARDPRYDEAKTSAYMKQKEIAIAVDVGVGEGKALIWTCDLTHRYIDINGSYRS